MLCCFKASKYEEPSNISGRQPVLVTDGAARADNAKAAAANGSDKSGCSVSRPQKVGQQLWSEIGCISNCGLNPITRVFAQNPACDQQACGRVSSSAACDGLHLAISKLSMLQNTEQDIAASLDRLLHTLTGCRTPLSTW